MRINHSRMRDHNLWQLACILRFSNLSRQLSEIKGLTISWCSPVTAVAVVTTHTRGQACKTAGHLFALNLVSFVALSGLDHNNTEREAINIVSRKQSLGSWKYSPQPQCWLLSSVFLNLRLDLGSGMWLHSPGNFASLSCPQSQLSPFVSYCKNNWDNF